MINFTILFKNFRFSKRIMFFSVSSLTQIINLQFGTQLFITIIPFILFHIINLFECQKILCHDLTYNCPYQQLDNALSRIEVAHAEYLLIHMAANVTDGTIIIVIAQSITVTLRKKILAKSFWHKKLPRCDDFFCEDFAQKHPGIFWFVNDRDSN